MDTYENDVPMEEQPRQEQTDNGFYHGIGSQTTETIQMPQPEPCAEALRQDKPTPKKGIGRKILRRTGAVVLAAALAVGGFGVGMGVTMVYSHHQNQTLIKYLENRLSVLEQELEDCKESIPSSVAPGLESGYTPSQIYQMNINSVVAINCVVTSTSLGQTVQGTSAGSGFVMTEDGYIVTNHHVIEGASSITVAFADGRSMDAKLIGSDSYNDIALIKIEAENLKPVTIGQSSNLHVGDQVVAIGNALGELSFSLSAGYVSGMDREVSTDGAMINMIQTDVAINSGNSGGPLFNSKGEVVGITSAKYSGSTSSGASIEGISFAIPTDDVIGMLEDLQQYGYIKKAYMGAVVKEVPSSLLQYGLPGGVSVDSVVKNGPADLAKIKAQDIITNIGGYDVTSLNDVTRVLRNFKAGDETTITVWRAGQILVLNITFGETTTN